MKKNIARVVKGIGAPLVGVAMLASTVGCSTFNPIQYIQNAVENSKNLDALTSRLQEESRIAKVLGVPRGYVRNLGNGYITDDFTKIDLLLASEIVSGKIDVKGVSREDLTHGTSSGVIHERLVDPEVFKKICDLADTNNDYLIPSSEATRLLNKVYEVALR